MSHGFHVDVWIAPPEPDVGLCLVRPNRPSPRRCGSCGEHESQALRWLALKQESSSLPRKGKLIDRGYRRSLSKHTRSECAFGPGHVEPRIAKNARQSF